MTLDKKQQWILATGVCAIAVMMLGVIIVVSVFAYMRSDAEEGSAVGAIESR